MLLILFYWSSSPFSEIINQIQIKISSLLTELTLEEGIVQGSYISISPRQTLVIDKACNGLIPYFFFLSSILAFPSTLVHKLKWAILGYFIITIVNIFRIWFITQLMMISKDNFSLAHDYLGNIFLVLTVVLLFISFIKTQ